MKQNLYIQKVSSTDRVTVRYSAWQQSSAILYLPRSVLHGTSYTLGRVRDLCYPKFIEPPLSNCMTEFILLVMMMLKRFAIAAQLPSVRGSAPYVDIFIGCTGTSKVGEIELSHPICFGFLRETDRGDSDADFRLDVVGSRGLMFQVGTYAGGRHY